MSQTTKNVFESRAKLMLSGEYAVLKGALSLAVPLKYGQTLTVETLEEESSQMEWQSKIDNQLWFSTTIHLPDLAVEKSNLPDISATICKILKAAKRLNPGFLDKALGYRITSVMDFDPKWGIGSSSSLISNIAFWAECNPYELNYQIFNGSGYDIACARAETPILYKTLAGKPSARNAHFYPDFHNQLYFVYLNRKQNSKESIMALDPNHFTPELIDTISTLTSRMVVADNLELFQALMDQHEALIGKILDQTPVKELHFRDFKGSIKSLGAWGGDFVLAASSADQANIVEYFAGKNLHTILKYNQIVLKK